MTPCPWCGNGPTIYERAGRWFLIHQCNGLSIDSEGRSREELERRWKSMRMRVSQETREQLCDLFATKNFEPWFHAKAVEKVISVIEGKP